MGAEELVEYMQAHPKARKMIPKSYRQDKQADIPLSIGFINIPAFIIFVPITTFMARIGAKTVQNLDRVKTQRLFGVFLYVIGTLFLYRFLNT